MRRARRTWWACALAVAACRSGSGEAARSTSMPDTSSTQSTGGRTHEIRDSQWMITTGRFGPLTAEGAEADLRRVFGSAAVKPGRIHLGEGEFWPGTVLYPDDSLRQAEITWQDTVERRKPWRATVRGRRSVWHVDGQIKLGSTLQELQRLNGKPFNMSGYGWDYGGRVMDWNGGVLDTTLQRNGHRIGFSLDTDSAGQESRARSQISGDRPFSSALPALQQLNPSVWEIFLDFPEAP